MSQVSKENQSFIERRKYPRREMFLVMEVEGSQPENRLRALTSNISAGGVYFKTLKGEEFQPGVEVSLTIFLSTAVPQGTGHPISLSGKGKVVRREMPQKDNPLDTGSNELWSGVALQFDKPLRFYQPTES